MQLDERSFRGRTGVFTGALLGGLAGLAKQAQEMQDEIRLTKPDFKPATEQTHQAFGRMPAVPAFPAPVSLDPLNPQYRPRKHPRPPSKASPSLQNSHPHFHFYELKG